MKIIVNGQGIGEHALVWKIAQSRKTEGLLCIPGNGATVTVAERQPIYDPDFMVQYIRKAQPDLTVVSDERLLEMGMADALCERHLTVFGMDTQSVGILSEIGQGVIPKCCFCIHGFCDGKTILWSPPVFHGTEIDQPYPIDRTERDALCSAAVHEGQLLLQKCVEKKCTMKGVFRFYLVKEDGDFNIISARAGMDAADGALLMVQLKGETTELLCLCAEGRLDTRKFTWDKAVSACITIGKTSDSSDGCIEGLGEVSRNTAVFLGDVELYDDKMYTCGSGIAAVICKEANETEALENAFSAVNHISYPGKILTGFRYVL